MIGNSDDVKVIELLAPLRALEPLPFAGSERRASRRVRRPVLASVIVVAALALAGVAIADGLGAFNGIAAAQHLQTGADVIDPATLAYMEDRNCPGVCMPSVQPVLDTFRVVGRLPSGHNIYVFTTKVGDLCYVVGPPQPDWGCEDPLTRSHPSTVFAYTQTGEPWTLVGIALDGVTSVSFYEGGQELTVPVKENVWLDTTDDAEAFYDAGSSLTAHFADGTTVVQTSP